ncbi:MAG: carboxypeptidase regulatory-like domain-containing protein [Acidobacteria bacterium]|nr:carboxypeptidase regulatory-like domain-containing protein [Acidobacteriota bacterium]MBV9669376.1 carboxypeptidase regulatory-like domain-containing protein [Terriglobales bacterium]
MATSFRKLAPLSLIFLCASVSYGQGLLSGKVTDKDGKTVAGVVIVVTNQTSTRQLTRRTQTDGSYVFRLQQGAYSVKVAPPYEARFDRGKLGDLGSFAKAVCDETKTKCSVLENVIMDGDHKLDFVAIKPDDEKPPEGQAKPAGAERREVLDRWRYQFPEYDRYGDKGAAGRDIPFRRNNRWYNPYDRNVLKGDYPIIGNDYFMILSGVSTTGVEILRTPSGNNVSSQNPNSNNFFGRPEKFALAETIQFSFEFFKGETVFRPRSWAIKLSPTFSVPNYLNARERGIVNVDVRRGTTRTDYQLSLEDAFFEYKLANTDKNYDFVSVRTGIQPFNADFRGFLFSDNNLGARLFGGFDNNKFQFNVAYFRQIEKDTNSGLNSMRSLRPQNVYIANLYRQDFLHIHGYTFQVIGALNDDRASRHTDQDGFVVRPAVIGSVRPHAIKAWYLGFNGDGHIGRLNLSHSYYFAFGHDSFNPIAGKPVEIRANMAALEASMDYNWLRYRASFFYASGDKNPTDNKANGFDAILDDPNFVGGEFSYWNRNGIRLLSTNVGLTQPNSLLPSLRSSKLEGQANFVNPGIMIFNAGMDADVTPTLKAIFNANYLRFENTHMLEYVLFDPRIRHEIGYDLSVGVEYRPFLINNITLTFGGNVLLPGRGFRDVYTDRSQNCPLPNFCGGPTAPNPSKTQYTLFAQTKFIF